MANETQGNRMIMEDPRVTALLEALEESGLNKERADVLALANYINSMEDKLAQMVDELHMMRQEVKSIHNNSLAGRCAQLVSSVEDKARQARDTVLEVKNNFLQAADRTVTGIQEKSRDALRQAVRAMGIPGALERMSGSFQQAARSMGQMAAKMDTMREQLHISGNYLKNAVYALAGRPVRETPALEADRGVLAKLRGLAEGLESSFDGMAQRAEELAGKLEPERQQEEISYSEPEALPETAAPAQEGGRSVDELRAEEVDELKENLYYNGLTPEQQEAYPDHLEEDAGGCILQNAAGMEPAPEPVPEPDWEPEM